MSFYVDWMSLEESSVWYINVLYCSSSGSYPSSREMYFPPVSKKLSSSFKRSACLADNSTMLRETSLLDESRIKQSRMKSNRLSFFIDFCNSSVGYVAPSTLAFCLSLVKIITKSFSVTPNVIC